MAITSFGKKLKYLRKEKKWTQDELAKQIGIHGRNIGKYETGNGVPSWETLKKLADVFEVPNEYFLIEEEKMPAYGPLKDKDLIWYFAEVEKMGEESQQVIKSVIEAMIVKEKERRQD